jgi:hypothetical protein
MNPRRGRHAGTWVILSTGHWGAEQMLAALTAFLASFGS